MPISVLGTDSCATYRLVLCEKCFSSRPVYLWRSTVAYLERALPCFHTLTSHSMVIFSTIRGIKYTSAVNEPNVNEPNPLIFRDQVVHTVFQQASYFNRHHSERQREFKASARTFFKTSYQGLFLPSYYAPGPKLRRTYALNIFLNDSLYSGLGVSLASGRVFSDSSCTTQT